MRRHSFLSSYKFLVIVLYTLVLIARRDGVVRSQCVELSKNQNLRIVFGYYTANNSSQPQNYISSTVLTHLNYVVSPNELLTPPTNVTTSYDVVELVKIRDSGTWQNGSGSILLSIPLFELSQADLDKVWSDVGGFVDNVMAFVNHYNLNGVDLGYPNKCNLNDDANFAILLSKLRNANSSNTLTITMGPQPSWTQYSQFNSSSFDFINIMAYQLNNWNINEATLNSPSSNSHQITYSQILSGFKNNNIRSDKIILGIDFGGIVELGSYKNASEGFLNNFNSSNFVRHQFGSGYSIEGSQPPMWNDTCQPNSRNQGYILLWSFRDIINQALSSSSPCSSIRNWNRTFDETSQEPYLYTNYDSKSATNQYLFVSYEDPMSINKKINWAINNNYGGIAIADLSKDTDDLMMLSAIGNYFSHGPSQSSSTGLPAPPASNSSGIPSSESSKTPSIAGLISGVVGGALLIMMLSILIVFIIKKRRRNNEMSLKPSENRSSPLIPPATVILTTTPETTAEPTAKINFVTALFDFEGKEDGDLSFKKGDRIEVIERGNGPVDWWVGKVNGVVGEFPGNYVRE